MATKRKTTTARKMCSKVIRREGLKVDGTLKKGYRYGTNGRIVKAKPVTTAKRTATAKRVTTARKRTPAKRRTSKKKSGILGLGILGIL